MSIFKQLQRNLILFTLLVLAGCGGDDDGFPTGACGGPDNPCPAYAIALDITPSNSVIAVSTHQVYQAIATYSDGASKDVTQQVNWTSSEPDLASISAAGIAQGSLAGEVQITATLNPLQEGGSVLTDSATLRVTDAALTALNIEPAQAQILVGMTQNYRALALFADGHQQDVTNEASWKSLSADIATLESAGANVAIATGLAVGVTQVKAQFSTQEALATLVVLATKPSRLLISPLDEAIPNGTSLQYQAHLILEDGLSIDVTKQSIWHSAAVDIAAIDEQGFLVAKSLGQTQVQATLAFAGANLSDSTRLTVEDAQVNNLVVTPAQSTVPLGSKGSYVATAYFSDGQVKDVSREAVWSASETEVIDIVAQGQNAGDAIAKAVGTSNISARYQAQDADALIEVTDAVITSLQISPINTQVPAGTRVQYHAYASFSDGSTKDVTAQGYWQSSQPQIASIGITAENGGFADTYLAGVTDIRFDYLGLSQSTELTVTEAKVVELQISPIDLQAPVGTQGQYSAIAYYSDGHSDDVTQQASWLSSNRQVVSIVNSGADGGYANALAEGRVTISATYAGVSSADPEAGAETVASATVSSETTAKVTPAVLQRLIISPVSASIAAGNNQDYQLFALFSDGSSKEVTAYAYWQSSDTNTATIDTFGVAHSLTEGRVNIVASYLGMQAIAELTVTDAVITQLQVSPVDSSIALGYKQRLVATAYYSDGHSSNVSSLANWNSLSSSIVQVNTVGLAEGVVEGSATVEASYQGMQASANVNVTSAVLESVTITPVTATVAAGNTQQYRLFGIFSDGSQKELTHVASWQSSRLGVATIDKHGLTQSYQQGETQIKASYIGVSAIAELKVTDAVVTGLQVSPANLSVPLGTTGQYRADAFYSDGHTSDVTHLATWSVSDPSLVNITATGATAGFAQATALGITKVQANFAGLNDKVDVTVTDAILEKLVISPAYSSIAAGLRQPYQATGVYSDGSSKQLTERVSWNSSDSDIATLDRFGVAQSYKAGNIQVSASYIGFNATAELKVTDAQLSYIRVTPTFTRVPLGTKGQFNARAFYTDNHSEDITEVATWRSNDDAIVHIGTGAASSGFASAMGVGQTEVTAQYLTAIDSAVVVVTPAELVELTLSPVDASIAAGLDQAYQAYARFTDGSNKEVTLESSWQSSETDIATVDSQGVAHTLLSGRTEIQASYHSLTAKASLVVNEPILVDLQVTPVSSTININESQQYVARAFYSDGYSNDVSTVSTWSLADDSIAHIVPSGRSAGQVTGDSQGQTVVTAHYSGIEAQAQVKVSDFEYLGVQVEPADTYVIVNKTTQLQAFAIYRNSSGTITQKEVTNVSDWRGGDASKVSIDNNGVAYGIESGITDTFAIYQGVQGQGRINVLDSELLGLTVTPDNLSAPIGTQGRYKAVATYIDRPAQDVTELATWSSSQSDVVHIVTSGKDGGIATARAIGMSEITAQFEGVVDSVSAQVTAAVIERIEITPRVDTVFSENIQQFYANAYFSDGSVVDITLDADWKSDDPYTISIETGNARAGEAMGVSLEGATSISASYAGLSDSLLLNVKPNVVERVEVTPNNLTLKNGDYQTVQVMVTYSNGDVVDYAKYVNWSSTDDNVAYGHRDTINAIGIGTAVVTASMGAVSGSAEVTVTP
ncbi:Ig-like domain-containing protein [Shewanella fidelis]|uniref:Ig-like domain-containing protein n=1 Tax=Shewanella fidelis TaxID=173509 RepID=A0AAW8NQ92_9GAMM|nr:Ig-like domain-containing protein [Shewanella fidelis]MDR8524896.1 Ig-like domain-containing protein [Shewanella fidelis]MDW4810967.1 Ig-like domain-containing protein [Shewanella fidelis]MDW4815254.1 Ig-like domain-containing protein [Shewanella fidelis]MDW4819344.1 Ig-like domain-containing protein [Shewanella fidelis]MDW4822978.1 Ig-like domain-containing protein [Shewanella fidelis]